MSPRKKQSSSSVPLDALQTFADSVTSKMSQVTLGEPEDQLRGPFEALIAALGNALKLKVVCTGETLLPGRVGKPDYAVHTGGLLTGFVELKAPGVGANPSRFKGHNRDQWRRFTDIPNILYCDGNDWGLYRSGEAVRPVVRIAGDVATDGKDAVSAKDSDAILSVLRDFFSWRPIIPKSVKELAGLLAPLCRMLREDVSDAIQDAQSPLVQLADDWRQLLFPNASNEQFADAYAQTVTFALLLAKSEGAKPLDLPNAQAALAAEHSLLSRALEVLTDPKAKAEISASLSLLLRVIGEVPADSLKPTGSNDPWLFFYEDFLAAYDPKLRKDAGAYYTPVEVVRAQVRLVDDLLTNRLGKTLGFASRDVVTLDPAAGTGTYLLGVIAHALDRVEAQQGAGALPGQATALASNIYGFEVMVGPFAVSELRASRALRDKGASLPPGGTHVYLTDTLESPHAKPPQLPLFLEPIAEQHKRALKVKSAVPVIVCLGNPPYDRHEAATETNKTRTGGWVRWGDDGTGAAAILNDFTEPAKLAGHGGDLKNLYNLYVYFWRWALWKVFESKTATGPGVVSFISASSYVDGDAFCGMREHVRRLCDEVWILDLGGEGRGTRKSENVFAIQTPVAVAVAVRAGKAMQGTPAKVHYTSIADSTRDEKLKALDGIVDFASLKWRDCPDDWHAPFRPPGTGTYFDWPLLTDLFPWQHSGVKAGRTWVIAPTPDLLVARWQVLCNADRPKRAVLFKNSRTGHCTNDAPSQLPPKAEKLKPIAEVPKGTPAPEIEPYAFRSFDRQHVFADARMLDRPGPSLWATRGPKQVFCTTLLNHPLGSGPAITAAANVADLHHFRGSFGAKEVVPLYRDAIGQDANCLPGLLDILAAAYGRKVTPEDLLAYVYGVLAHPGFTERFTRELGTCELRLPLTKDPDLFAKVKDTGARLVWLHTYGTRFVPKGKHAGALPKGAARCVKAVPGDTAGYPEKCEYDPTARTLRVGAGEFAPVAPEVYEFEVSGLKVVQSWLKYRMKGGAGKKSSPLDDIHPTKWTGDFTTELLELLWVLEATTKEYPKQAELLAAVLEGPLFEASELPAVPEIARKSPTVKEADDMFPDH